MATPRKPELFNLAEMSFEDMRRARQRIDQELVIKRREEISALRAKLTKMVTDKGFTLSEIFPRVVGSKPAAKSKGYLPAKYQNPDNRHETWSGRGRRPHWVEKAVEKGEDLSAYAI